MKGLGRDLMTVFRAPETVDSFSLSEWDLLIRQARRANVLPRLSYLLEARETPPQIPEEAQLHLDSARLLAEGHARSVRWEVNRISRALHEADAPVILLKGAAYLLAELDIGRGRIFNDIDILVRQDKLSEVETALEHHGWVTTHHNAYDQRYFREWMHELPPLKHVHRQTLLDVHHTILPVTAKLTPDADKLFSAIVPFKAHPGIYTLDPLDMILHSAAHLFHEGEFDQGFRGLTDLDGLLNHFSSVIEDFWPRLLDRAIELDLKQPLYYALILSKALLATPVPQNIIEQIEQWRVAGWAGQFTTQLYKTALRPHHHSTDSIFSGLSCWMLFVRSHYLKMPLHLLIPHLVRKAVRSEKDE